MTSTTNLINYFTSGEYGICRWIQSVRKGGDSRKICAIGAQGKNAFASRDEIGRLAAAGIDRILSHASI